MSTAPIPSDDHLRLPAGLFLVLPNQHGLAKFPAANVHNLLTVVLADLLGRSLLLVCDDEGRPQ